MTATAEDIRRWILTFTDKVIDAEDQLTELDRLAGDGDFGWNVSSALRRARPHVEAATAGPADILAPVTDAFLAAGGTSGALFGLWFGSLAATNAPVWPVGDLADAVLSATDAVRRLGGADVGDRTMVDAMVPAGTALEAAAPHGWDAALSAAATAAHDGAESTRGLVARRGRASYVGKKANGVTDPGALTIAWFFAAGERR
ncbi:DAK2 domain-containing protein [Mycolicibacterium goodii]